MRPRNARTRLVLATALLIGLAMVLVLGLVYWTVNRIIESETRNVVHAELNGLADSYSSLGILGLSRAIERRISNDAEPDAVYLLTDSLGRSIAGNLGAWPPHVKPGGGWVHMDLIRTDNDRSVPIAAASVQLRGGERLLVGRDSSTRLRFDRVLGRSLALALLAAFALSLANGWLLSRLVFSRIADISDTAEEIVSGDLSRRIPLRQADDEFDRLGTTLNEMLDRIEDLVANLRMTTDSLAHDLRSPLTRLSRHVEQLADPDLAETDREVLAGRAMSEIDHLLRVFSDLTEIARAEAGLGRMDFEAVDIAALARDVVEFYQPVGAERHVTLVADGSADPIPGHQALLSQALSNLLDNALRYAPDATQVHVTVEQDARNVRVIVADQGPGIPQDEHESVLKPFVTLDPSRTGGASGLGLALVGSVARLHGGAISLADNTPGLVVTMTLPRP